MRKIYINNEKKLNIQFYYFNYIQLVYHLYSQLFSLKLLFIINYCIFLLHISIFIFFEFFYYSICLINIIFTSMECFITLNFY